METYVCKVVILEEKNFNSRILKPKKMDQNTLINLPIFNKVSNVKKCLFGKADPKDTERMLKEQNDIERRRFQERFGFDLNEIEDEIDEDNNENLNLIGCGNSVKKSRKILKGKRKNLSVKGRNQTVMTDFFKERKQVVQSSLMETLPKDVSDTEKK